MHRLLTAYTTHYNRRHNHHGHLFQEHFKSLLVDKSGYFLTVSRYIYLNPARDGDPRVLRTTAKRRESLAENGASGAEAVITAVAGYYDIFGSQIRQGLRLGENRARRANPPLFCRSKHCHGHTGTLPDIRGWKAQTLFRITRGLRRNQGISRIHSMRSANFRQGE